MTAFNQPNKCTNADIRTTNKLANSYHIHSMLHSVRANMQPTKLEMLDGFEKMRAGHRFTPPDSNVKVNISGRDWSAKRILVYGSKSTEEAESHIDDVKKSVEKIGHDICFTSTIKIANLAINGSLQEDLDLELVFGRSNEQDIEMEYEPEQFPGLILRITEPKCTFILFSTGSYVIQGLKNPDNVTPALVRLAELLGCAGHDPTGGR